MLTSTALNMLELVMSLSYHCVESCIRYVPVLTKTFTTYLLYPPIHFHTNFQNVDISFLARKPDFSL